MVLEKEMATHSSVLAWKIPGMAEPSGLPSMGSHRVGLDWSDLAAAAAGHWAAERLPRCAWSGSQVPDVLVQGVKVESRRGLLQRRLGRHTPAAAASRSLRLPPSNHGSWATGSFCPWPDLTKAQSVPTKVSVLHENQKPMASEISDATLLS